MMPIISGRASCGGSSVTPCGTRASGGAYIPRPSNIFAFARSAGSMRANACRAHEAQTASDENLPAVGIDGALRFLGKCPAQPGYERDRRDPGLFSACIGRCVRQSVHEWIHLVRNIEPADFLCFVFVAAFVGGLQLRTACFRYWICVRRRARLFSDSWCRRSRWFGYGLASL